MDKQESGQMQSSSSENIDSRSAKSEGIGLSCPSSGSTAEGRTEEEQSMGIVAKIELTPKGITITQHPNVKIPIKATVTTVHSGIATKLPNIIKSSQHQAAMSQSVEAASKPDNKIQIFPLSGTTGTENPSTDIMCLSIVNGKIQNVREKLQETGSISNEVAKPVESKNSEEEKLNRQLGEFGLKCSKNEFNAIEIDTSVEEDEDQIDLSCKEKPPLSPRELVASPRVRDDQILCCNGCGCYGMPTEFFNAESCSVECQNRIVQKRKEKEKRERDLQIQKTRREAKKREREAREAEERRQREELRKNEEEAKQKSARQGTTDPLVKSEGFPTQIEIFHPWNPEASFSWESYLKFSGSKAAPSKLFKCPFPVGENLFKPGMKLEAIDPEHPSLICVVTVAEVLGFRLRLHLDGYSDCHDFWENANSPNIFPSGFCREHGQTLQPPKTHVGRSFIWPAYLKETNSEMAPKEAFFHKSESADLSGWRVGFKLEAVDRQNTSLVCVATVTNILEGRILIHFDGWEIDFDYWTTPSSPYIHPLGWCEQNGVKLHPPKGYTGEFSWEKYLKETLSMPAPNWVFKPSRSEVSLFRKGMKLEAVDKRNPSLIRVASVADVLMHQIKIHFDGWPNEYDFWVEDTSLDIHPVMWCQRTKHPLMPPLTTEEVNYHLSRGGCQVPGCRGIGHIKGSKFFTHSTRLTCPYAIENLDNDSAIPDRLHGAESSNESSRERQVLSDLNLKEDSMSVSQSSLGRGNRKRKPRKFFDEENSQVEDKSRRKSITKSTTAHYDRTDDTSEGEQSIRSQVFQPGYKYSFDETKPQAWEKNSSFLKNHIEKLKIHEVIEWTPHQVADFIASLPGVRFLNGDEIFHRIVEEEVDGEALLLLDQNDLVKVLGLKLGPALKVFNAVVLIKKRLKSVIQN